ncbi:exodeoxyribonuclease VII large subunit [Terriglobus albidus]|uniref:exodeoxyribonuclease VII large subunit n=1 Tax=Terriglobus albidus TaxID=1592106 RepID=UPI0021E038E7|nr:exodeoxyribonuclease VII large subunit [Terriglobus albidus]
MPTLAQLRSGRTSDTAPQLGFAFEEPEAAPQAAEPAARPAPRRTTFSVAELVSLIRGELEKGYGNISVFGEVSNCRPASSGHVYFTLKDGEAQLPVVLFRRQAQMHRFRIEDGLEVLVRGRVSVYESRGQLQLIAESVEPRGAGALQLAFEQLKARLQTEGLFDADRKRPLPAFPTRIGIVTSPTGAVIRDIVNVIRRRHACLDLLVYPAAVQGASSPLEVANGIRYFNQAAGTPHAVDVILLARGGGSAEDLAGFNDEALARMIAASELPIVSAVGHETDFTIADFVSDLRAPTPSAAAELITAAQHRIEDHVATLGQRLVRAARYTTMQAGQRFARINAQAILYRVEDAISRRYQRLDELAWRANSAVGAGLQRNERRLLALHQRLAARDLTRQLSQAQQRVSIVESRLVTAHRGRLSSERNRVQAVSTALQSLSPLAVLQRGYALVYDADGRLLRDAAEAAPGSSITARLHKGSLDATVTGKRS